MSRLSAASDIGLVSFLPVPASYGNSVNQFFDFPPAGLPVV